MHVPLQGFGKVQIISISIPIQTCGVKRNCAHVGEFMLEVISAGFPVYTCEFIFTQEHDLLGHFCRHFPVTCQLHFCLRSAKVLS